MAVLIRIHSKIHNASLILVPAIHITNINIDTSQDFFKQRRYARWMT